MGYILEFQDHRLRCLNYDFMVHNCYHREVLNTPLLWAFEIFIFYFKTFYYTLSKSSHVRIVFYWAKLMKMCTLIFLARDVPKFLSTVQELYMMCMTCFMRFVRGLLVRFEYLSILFCWCVYVYFYISIYRKIILLNITSISFISHILHT